MIQCVFVQSSKEDDKMVKDTILVIDVDVDGIQEIMNILLTATEYVQPAVLKMHCL